MLESIFNTATYVITTVLSAACRMNMTHWSIVAAVLVGIGGFCMRGLGSRRI